MWQFFLPSLLVCIVIFPLQNVQQNNCWRILERFPIVRCEFISSSANHRRMLFGIRAIFEHTEYLMLYSTDYEQACPILAVSFDSVEHYDRQSIPISHGRFHGWYFCPGRHWGNLPFKNQYFQEFKWTLGELLGKQVNGQCKQLWLVCVHNFRELAGFQPIHLYNFSQVHIG